MRQDQSAIEAGDLVELLKAAGEGTRLHLFLLCRRCDLAVSELTWILATAITRAFRDWMAMRMKCKLIDRGATADEIVRIIEAGSTDDRQRSMVVLPRPPVKMSPPASV